MRVKVLSLSLAFWSLFAIFGIRPGHLGLGGWSTDQNSHIDSAILFWHRGFDIYKKPVRELAQLSASETAQEYVSRYGWPADSVYDLPERPGKPPLLLNGPTIPVPYPPGMILYSAPEALLKEAFSLSPKTAATLSLIKYLIAAHFLAWLLWGELLAAPEDEATKGLARWVILPIVYLELVGWSLSGIYDSIALIPLVLCVQALRKRRGLDALFWYSAAAFLHFRTLWFLPLLLWALWLVRSSRENPFRKPEALPFALCAAIMLAWSFYSFVLIYPMIKAMGTRNFFFVDGDAASFLRLSYLLAPVALAGAGLWRERAWLALSCLAWALVMVCRSPFVQMWHSLYLLPLLAMTGLGERSAERARLFALLAYVVMASLAFTRFPMSGVLVMDCVKEVLG